MPSLAAQFDPRNNSLNAIRLMLAAAVIVAHSWPVGGYGESLVLGDWSVAGFFAISGFLITGSRLSSRSLLDYFWRRVLRIFPAFIAALVLTAGLAAPVWVAIAGRGDYDRGSAFSYVYKNLGLQIHQWQIDGTLIGVGFPDAWNGSAWTLFYEFLCYVGIGLVATVVARRYLPLGLLAGLLACILVSGSSDLADIAVPETIYLTARLGGFFIAGALVYLHRDRIPVSAKWAAIAAVLTITAGATALFNVLGPLPVAYLVMYLGVRLPLSRVNNPNDISYGVYIYAMPVQQLLAEALGGWNLHVGAFALLCVIATVPVAVLSWYGLEKPVMRLKRLTAERGRETTVVRTLG
jgi:peptidoglycan/LPS O-acetylase OafA/YrhL